LTGIPTYLVSKVFFPSWSENNQSDIIWYSGNNVAASTYNAVVSATDHPGLAITTDCYLTIGGKQYYWGRAQYSTNPDYQDYLNIAASIPKGDATVEAAIAYGLSFIGQSPYDWGGGRTASSIAQNFFDCSSFVNYIYAHAGKTIENQAIATTYNMINVGQAISWASLQRGDLMYTSNLDHVALYLGDGYFLHDSPYDQTGGVAVTKMTDEEDPTQFGNLTWNSVWGNASVRRVG
jgi:cell wall-associated NlpC family hydrolase